MTEPGANEADLFEQRQNVQDDEEPLTPSTLDVEADPADLHEQSLPVPSEEEDWPDA